MENVSSIKQNLYGANIASESQQNKSSVENFTALDREKLKQDSLELATKADNLASENWLYRKMRGFGIDNPKKKLKSILYTAIAVVGLMFIGDKLSSPTYILGEKISDFLLNNRFYNSVSDFFETNIQKLKDLKKPRFIEDIIDTVKNRPAKMKLSLARGYEKGPVAVFTTTVKEIIEKSKGSSEALSSILGEEGAQKLLDDVSTGIEDPQKYFADLTNKMLNHVRSNFPDVIGRSDGEILDLMKNNKLSGVDLSSLTQVNMNCENPLDFFGSWWPANVINSIGTKIGQIVKKDPNYNMNFCRGNLFDSLIKFNAINGTGAKTTLGRLIQKSVTLPTEANSNFVNDKSVFGLLLCGTLINTFDNVQDAPKEQKLPTINNEIATQTLNWALSMPIAYKVLYSGLASMKNLKADTIPAKILKQAGKFFGMGLDYYKDGNLIKNTNKATGIFGGVLRFVLMMFVISPIVSKQVSKVANKVFGKPYNKDEVEKQKKAEEEMNKIIPELGISQKELMEKIQANPDILKKIEQDPILAQKIQNDPKALLELLSGKTNENNIQQKSTPALNSGQQISQANREILNRRSTFQNSMSQKPKTQMPQPQNLQPQMPLEQNKQVQNTQINALQKKPIKDISQGKSLVQTYESRDNLTYIPSSDPAQVPESTLSPEQKSEFDYHMARADKALKNAEKYM